MHMHFTFRLLFSILLGLMATRPPAYMVTTTAMYQLITIRVTKAKRRGLSARVKLMSQGINSVNPIHLLLLLSTLDLYSNIIISSVSA
jgi:hypothetical protein